MAEGPLQKDKLIASGREASAPIKRDAKRPSPLALSRHRLAAYCAHAPEPYAAMASRGDWSTKLWDIFGQPGGANMCCLSLWCPCVQYGLIMEQLPPGGSVTCAGSVAGGCALFCVLCMLGDVLGSVFLARWASVLPCSALIHCQTRGYIRRKYGIQSHPLHDFFITWCCMPCALCQEAREIVVREAAEREGSLPPSRGLGLSRSASPVQAAGGRAVALGAAVHGAEVAHRGPLHQAAGGHAADAGGAAHGLALVQATGTPGHPAAPPAQPHISTLSLGAGVAVVHTASLPPQARAVHSCATVTPTSALEVAGVATHATCVVVGPTGLAGGGAAAAGERDRDREREKLGKS